MIESSNLYHLIISTALALAAVAAAGLALSFLLRRLSGLPGGEIVYEDADGTSGDLLVSSRYGLCGKPDYLLEGEDGELIPVEVKSGSAPRNGHPYESHLLQLAVYFVLIEDVLGYDVDYGFIRYRDQTLRVANTNELRDELFSVVAEMREAMHYGNAERNHNQPRRCASCSMAHACNERLA